MERTVDVVVVGGGSAGLNAALVLARSRRSVIVIDAGQPRNAMAGHLHGFLTRDGMAIPDLISAGRAEIEQYDGTVMCDEVVEVVRRESGFAVTTGSGERIAARRILVATGLKDMLPEVPGLADRWGRDVLHCPYCHGYEVRDLPFGVLAAGEESVHEALSLLQWSADITLVLDGLILSDTQAERLAARGITVVDDSVSELIVKDDQLAGLRLTGGGVVDVQALFIGPEFRANHALLESLGAEIGEEGVVADVLGRTTAPGVFAAGNVVDPTAQVINAAGAGSLAAIGINNDLVDEDTDDAVRRARG